MEVKRNLRKERIGTVVSHKADKTIVVRINRKKKHPLYGKYIKQTTKLMAHDAENRSVTGDEVKIAETRPLSKKKCWRLVEIFKQANPS